jgi:hypothetical protein
MSRSKQDKTMSTRDAGLTQDSRPSRSSPSARRRFISARQDQRQQAKPRFDKEGTHQLALDRTGQRRTNAPLGPQPQLGDGTEQRSKELLPGGQELQARANAHATIMKQ